MVLSTASVCLLLITACVVAEGAAESNLADATNGCTTSLIHLARAHCELAMLKNYHSSVAQTDVAPTTQAVLRLLGSVWLFELMKRQLGDFLEDGYLSTAQV